jgi:hypothetical protein
MTGGVDDLHEGYTPFVWMSNLVAIFAAGYAIANPAAYQHPAISLVIIVGIAGLYFVPNAFTWDSKSSNPLLCSPPFPE